MIRNPVMFVVEVGSLLTTIFWIRAVLGTGEESAWFIGLIAVWLWITVLFANFCRRPSLKDGEKPRLRPSDR